MAYWFDDVFYEEEQANVISSLVDFAKGDQPGVESTYNVPFNISEAGRVLRYYLHYSYLTKKYYTTANETSWLANPFFKYIVSQITGTETYSYIAKGLRDRIWVYLAGLNKLGSTNGQFTKWLKPYEYTGVQPAPIPVPDKKEVIPVVPPPASPDDSSQKENKQSNSMLIVAGAAVLAVVTKYMDLW